MNDCRSIEGYLEDAVLSALPEAEAHAVAEHLRYCPSCARTSEAFRELRARRPALPAVPESYWVTLLPRLRERIDARPSFQLPDFLVRFVSPVCAALFLLAVIAELVPTVPGSAPGDAAMLLRSLPESELASVAERHDSEAPIILPADVAENVSADMEESSVLQEIVDGETGVNLYSYVDPDVAVGDLAEADQVQLISMLERP